MSDLQCPAVFILLTPDTVSGAELRDQRLTGVYIASSVASEARVFDDARRLAAVHACRLEHVTSDDEDSLIDRIEELADVHRGETVALIAPGRALCAVIECLDPPNEPIAIEVDGGGIRVIAT